MRAVKLAQPGYDVKTTGDENLIYSSRWPLLPIYKQGSMTVDISQDTVLTEHDLGYPAAYWIFVGATPPVYSSLDVEPREISEFNTGVLAEGAIGVDNNKLIFKAPAVPPTQTGKVNLYYYLFALDLTKQYNAPIIKVGSVAGGGGSRVFKIAKPHKSIRSSRLEDFIIHSKARSPLIHSVNPGKVTGGEFKVTHGLGYNPLFFAYTYNTYIANMYTLLPTGSGGSSILTADNETITFSEAGNRTMSIVVLKDPFDIEYSVRVDV